MLTVKKCQEILNKKEQKYTKDQTEKVRNLLYQLAGIMNDTKDNNYGKP
jgi:hypothetical protein